MDVIQNLINGIQLGSIYVLGYTMVYGVLRLINFAHSDVFMVGSFVGYYTAVKLQAMGWLTKQTTLLGGLLHLLPVMLVSMAVCVVLGLIIERLAYRPLRRAPRLTALITAIGVSKEPRSFRLCSGSIPSSTPRSCRPARKRRCTSGI
jgi:branched-chain amino acid transport system permease protein